MPRGRASAAHYPGAATATGPRPADAVLRSIGGRPMAADISLTDPHTVPTRYWHRLDDGRLQCVTCPRAGAGRAGYIGPGRRSELSAHMDPANIDLRGFTEDFYRHVAMGDLHTVLDTLVYLRHETGVWLEITTLLIPGHNDGDEEVAA